MRKLILLSILSIALIPSFAQNLQVHYDFGADRQMITTTMEMFKPDKMGSTFFFIDMDYGSKASEVDGINLAYWEISRSMRFIKEMPALEVRGEFNGGFGRGQFTVGETVNQYHYSINNAWLGGLQYTFNNEDFSKVFTLQANYKYIYNNVGSSFQITGVWALHFFDRKLSFMGFADFWREDVGVMDDDGNRSEKEYVFLTEPQLWYKLSDHFSAGSEIEISSNFGGNDGFMVNPTLAVKWTF